MESLEVTCLTHQNLKEMYCTTCKIYLCPECISFHDALPVEHDYLHITQYAPKMAIPKIDELIEATPERIKEASQEIEELKNGLEEFISPFIQLVDDHEAHLRSISILISQLNSNMKQKPNMNTEKEVKRSLDNTKKRLKRCLEGSNIIEALKIAQMVDNQEKLIKLKSPHKELIKGLKDILDKINEADIISEVYNIIVKLFLKYDSFKIPRYVNDWKCEREYLSEKLKLSEDGLSVSVSTSNGYPAIIGDVDFYRNLYAFEVIPEGLDCNSKEGFGIIEKDKYLEAQKSNPSTPTVYDKMIGYFFKNEAKNMTIESMKDMEMGKKYIVKADMLNLVMTIKGPGVSLTANLEPDVAYVPCFSCGCKNNKFKIRPLISFHEGEIKKE